MRLYITKLIICASPFITVVMIKTVTVLTLKSKTM